MRILAWLRSFASVLFHRSRFEDDMDEELRAHIHDRASDLERAGLSRPEAAEDSRHEENSNGIAQPMYSPRGATLRFRKPTAQNRAVATRSEHRAGFAN